jgi:hypothetical protein
MAHPGSVAGTSEEMQLAAVEQRLSSMYADFPAHEVSSAVRDAHARFEHSRIRDFVPLLVERQARAELAKTPRTAPT